MADLDESALTADEILTFGPLRESAPVWNVAWLLQEKAPIAVAAGRAKFGKVFDDRGVGRAVLIRPCMSRGRRIRGLAPVYTPRMLEAHASVFQGWPMYMDHVPAGLGEALARRGRSIKEIGGQVLTPFWQRDFAMEDDDQYGYRPGAVLSEVWATPYVRQLVGENPNVLHTSISAWPTSGKPDKVPWNPAQKGMVIEGIRRQPQGSVDFVPRGGAGGRLMLAEGEDGDTRAWPEAAWTEEDRRFVISLAESFYAVADMAERAKPTSLAECRTADELRTFISEQHPHLAPALAEAATPVTGSDGAATTAATTTAGTAASASALTEADVKRLIEQATADTPDPDKIAEKLTEQLTTQFTGVLAEREQNRALEGVACGLIESAEGIFDSWKADLKGRYAVGEDGTPPAMLLVTEADLTDEKGNARTAREVVEERVKGDLQTVRDRIAEARGKPRVTGEGAGTRKATGDERTQTTVEEQGDDFGALAVELGIAESADDAYAIHGYEKVEGS